jgi:hypothetical protein
MKVRRDDLPRDLKVLRYLDALNAGELETAMILWEEASQDPELERILIELDGALFAEVSGGDQPASAGPELGVHQNHRPIRLALGQAPSAGRHRAIANAVIGGLAAAGLLTCDDR